jgi:hypothetical protein
MMPGQVFAIDETQKNIIAAHALFLAKTDIHRAMSYVERHMPLVFMLNSQKSDALILF